MPNNIAKRYYPRLSEVVKLEDLPEFLNFIENGLEAVFNKIHYKNLQYSKSYNGDAAFYSLDLVTRDRLQFPLPGGMQLVLNPDEDGDSGISSFPIAIEYKWEILAFIRAFKLQEFSYSLEDFYQLGLKVFRLTDEQVAANVLNFFVEPEDENTSRYQQVLNDVNAISNENLAFPSGEEGSFSGLMQLLNGADIPDNISMMLFGIYVLKSDSETTKRNLDSFYKRIVPEGIEAYLKKLITPKVKAGFTLSAGLEFPRKMLTPVYNPDGSNPFNPTEPVDIEKSLKVIPPDANDEPKFMLRFGEAEFNVDTERGLGYQMDLALSSNAYTQIADTGFILFIDNMKLDLSKTSNIDEATLDGRPADFIGAYIEEASISFPAKWNHDAQGSTAQIFASKVLVGTGGISGTIGMRAIPGQETSETPNGLLQLKLGDDFRIGLKAFDLTFHQNAIVSSGIHGFLQIPGFKDENGDPAVIDIDVHIGQDGEFSVVATADPPFKKIGIPHAFDFDIRSAFVGREKGDDGRFYLGISGELDITAEGPIGKFLPDKLDIKKMLIYDDGTFEFEGGKIVLPRAYEIKFGPATLSITGIHMGSHDQDGRKYKYFGFDGGVSTNPGGIDAQGKGLKFYYTVDGDPFKWFIRLESLTVDIILPSGTNPDKAAVIIHGFLSISEPKIQPDTPPAMVEVLKNSQEYAGGVSVKLPKFKGLAASAAMRMNPKVPAFIIDLGVEMKTPILLGSTGLGIYGFRALLGKRYVAEKTAAGIPADGEWWQYYKAKIDPDYREGIQVSKFNTKNGFSLGAGVSLATASDSGKIFSSKLFFMLSLPDVFLFQGQAQFLKERIGLDANPDPPFFAIIAITNHSIEAGFGVNYKLRDEGKLVTVDGVIEMGFFWGNSGSWYINVGRETPEDRRIQARIFDILNMYFYLMLSSGGIRLGAGVKFEWAKKFGPLSAELKAYIDTFGKISRRPRQIGGAIKMGGKVGIKVCGFGFSVSGSATLAAEASKPHLITGEFEVCVMVLKKERCARFEFTWDFDTTLDVSEVPVLIAVNEEGTRDNADAERVAGMTHMVTGERFPVAYTFPSSFNINSIPAPNTWITNNNTSDYRVPIDSFFDVDFKKGMNVSTAAGNNLDKIGGQSAPAQFMEFVPPIRGKSDRVRHEYYLDNLDILYWDEYAQPAPAWKPYNFYNAMLPSFDDAPESLEISFDQQALQNAKWGYWQQQAPGINNKLRIMATSPVSYTAGTGDAYTIEDLGVNSSTILCPGDKIPETCISFDQSDVSSIFKADKLRNYKQVLFRTVNQDGVVAAVPFDTFNQGLFVSSGDTLEMYYPEPMWSVRLRVNTSSTDVTAKFYRRIVASTDVNGLPVYAYDLMHTITKTGDFEDPIYYDYPAHGIDMVSITPGTCKSGGVVTTPTPDADKILPDITKFLTNLVGRRELTSSYLELYDQNEGAYASFFGSSLYPHIPQKPEKVQLIQQHIGASSLAFAITDSNGYSCTYHFEPLSLPPNFTFDSISGVKSVEVYTADDTLGYNNNLIVYFDVVINKITYTASFILTTCHALSVGYNSCSAALYKMCYLSYANFLLNSTVMEQTEQNLENEAMFEAISKTLQPVWRPNTTFAIRIKTSDKVFIEGSSSSIGAYQNNVVFGFRTAGPVGHFHSYPTAVNPEMVITDRKDYKLLDEAGKGDQFRLKSLKSYIDYTKSYPNADGNLSNAKPLFYNDAKLRLFYLYNHVYYFYSDWTDYEHTDKPNVAASSLEVRVLDPATTLEADATSPARFEANTINHASPLGAPPALIHSVNSDISLLNNLLINGSDCSDHDPVAPIDISSYRQMNLKPLKLYTAQFIAHYNPRIGGNIAGESAQSLVHSYVFQTSRYGSFAEQVNSYVLKQNANQEIEKAAIYSLDCPVNPDLNLVKRVIRDQLIPSDEGLRNQYADRFDRLVNGVLALDAKTLNVPVTTEFNVVKANGKIIGILIRNPEPFNHPKIPLADPEISASEAMETMMVRMNTGSGWGSVNEFYVIHSKDRSQLFVTLRNFSFDLPEDANLEFNFRYKEFDGVNYTNSDVPVTIQINNTSNS